MLYKLFITWYCKEIIFQSFLCVTTTDTHVIRSQLLIGSILSVSPHKYYPVISLAIVATFREDSHILTSCPWHAPHHLLPLHNIVKAFHWHGDTRTCLPNKSIGVDKQSFDCEVVESWQWQGNKETGAEVVVLGFQGFTQFHGWYILNLKQ